VWVISVNHSNPPFSYVSGTTKLLSRKKLGSIQKRKQRSLTTIAMVVKGTSEKYSLRRAEPQSHTFAFGI
jgi:hypothetical protein